MPPSPSSLLAKITIFLVGFVPVNTLILHWKGNLLMILKLSKIYNLSLCVKYRCMCEKTHSDIMQHVCHYSAAMLIWLRSPTRQS